MSSNELRFFFSRLEVVYLHVLAWTVLNQLSGDVLAPASAPLLCSSVAHPLAIR